MGFDRINQQRRHILFLTGTRADFGKIKPLIRAVDNSSDFDCTVFATGMHTLDVYGYTVDEVRKAGFSNVHIYMNQFMNEPADLVLSNTIAGLARYVHESHPDMMIVHGDRLEALAGASVGALRNIRVAHIEGGELSGTVDESIRHAITKLSHLHFVANDEAARRLVQLGENPESIFIIGSPDLDVMLSESLPELDEVKKRYEFDFESYAIAIFHPVTTELDTMEYQVNEFVKSLKKSGDNYVVIYPNNDEGSNYIIDSYRKLTSNDRFRIYPSIRFEYFLVLLKNASYIIGNSSAGVREAPFYGCPSINIGTRQYRRYSHPTIIDVLTNENEILNAISKIRLIDGPKSNHFGTGNSLIAFMEILNNEHTWNVPVQKYFQDL